MCQVKEILKESEGLPELWAISNKQMLAALHARLEFVNLDLSGFTTRQIEKHSRLIRLTSSAAVWLRWQSVGWDIDEQFQYLKANHVAISSYYYMANRLGICRNYNDLIDKTLWSRDRAFKRLQNMCCD